MCDKDGVRVVLPLAVPVRLVVLLIVAVLEDAGEGDAATADVAVAELLAPGNVLLLGVVPETTVNESSAAPAADPTPDPCCAASSVRVLTLPTGGENDWADALQNLHAELPLLLPPLPLVFPPAPLMIPGSTTPEYCVVSPDPAASP